jgi:isochorismate pyruvate lyase
MENCTNLTELRECVDKIDEQIIDLIAQRNSYIKQAATFKNSVDEVKSQDRIDQVIDNARHQALLKGLSPNLIAKIYKTMIDEMVELEIAEYRNTKAF